MSYDYSDFTSSDNVYVSSDREITQYLEEVKEYACSVGIKASIPQPADKCEDRCFMFDYKLQTWPVYGIEKDRYAENMIPCACAAVVKGQLNSLGYIFDYKSIEDAFNNSKLINIRKNLKKGIYPDENCRFCYLCDSKEQYYKSKR